MDFWDIFLAIVMLVGGFFLLVKGADWFVDGAAGIATKLRIPQLVIGLTIVAFGTSLPELATSVTSSIEGNVGFAIGNVLGSNITNILLILGLAACFCALPVQKDLMILDLPLLLGGTVLVILLGYFDNEIGRLDGGIMFFVHTAYTVFLVWWAIKRRKKEPTMSALNDHEVVSTAETPTPVEQKGFKGWYTKMKERAWFLACITVVGLGLIVGGAFLAVDGAETIAYAVGLSDKVVGLTVVAVGTSLPELITCVVAARKGETDIAVGDIVGSNLSNILRVTGICALITPLPFSSDGSSFLVDGLIALGAAAILAIFAYAKGHKVRRWQGSVMLACFVAYYVYLFVTM